MSQTTRLRIECSTDRGQAVAINVLIGCFTVLVSLLGLVFGAAVVFVVLAFSLLRLLIAFVDGWLTAFAGQSQQATRVYPFRRGASRASLP